MPPDNLAAGRSRNGDKPVLASSSAMRCSRSRFALPEQPAEEIDVFEHRQRRVQIPPRPCGM